MRPAFVERALPFLAWPAPTRASLQADALAGFSVALLVIPQSLAYAQLAGLPAQHGLYAAFLPAIVGALFGSSAILSTGPVALTSLLTAASVSVLAPVGSPAYLTSVLLLSLLAGLFQAGFGLARAGILVNLLSHPVMVGFTSAAALVIALSQLPALTGIAIPGGGSTLMGVGRMLAHLDTVHRGSVAIGVIALLMLIGFKRLAPRLPGVLIMVGIATGWSYASDFAASGGAVVGAIPQGMPSLSVPELDWQGCVALLPAAFVIALVSFMEAMSSCQVIAGRTRTRWDENQELVGQGLAKILAAFCSAMPVSGSFSRSALNLSTGARTGCSALVTAAIVGLALWFFTSLLFHLPIPALAALIVLAVFSLIDPKSMANAWKAGRDDGLAALLTFGGTLAFAPNIQNGILVGLVFSLGAFIYRRMVPRIAVLRLADDGAWVEVAARPVSGDRIVAVRFDAALFFANASLFEAAVLRIERENPDLKCVVVLAQGINLLDATGVEVLRRLNRHLSERDIALVVSQAKPHFIEVAERTGLRDELGRSDLLDTHESAVQRARHCAERAVDRGAAPS